MIKVLVVDDSALMRKLIGQILATEADIEVAFARNGKEALAMIGTVAPNVVTLDIQMPEMDGLACLDRIMIEHPCAVVMVSSLTAEGAEATLEAFSLGAVDFVAKPGGAVSLAMADLGPTLIEKVRAAAGARLRSSHRLKDRVRHRLGLGSRRERPVGAPSVAQGPMPAEGVVLVGTSTGGPPALEALLGILPADFPWPIVVAQHMPAGFTGPLAARLDRLSSITVTELTEPTELAPAHAYVGRGDSDVLLSRRRGKLFAMPAPKDPGFRWHPSADRLVASALEHVDPAAIIGVLMTGMGDDGARTMAELRRRGGRTIAEAEETAVVWGMPGELVRANGADWILPLGGIAERLRKLVAGHAAHPQNS